MESEIRSLLQHGIRALVSLILIAFLKAEIPTVFKETILSAFDKIMYVDR